MCISYVIDKTKVSKFYFWLQKGFYFSILQLFWRLNIVSDLGQNLWLVSKDSYSTQYFFILFWTLINVVKSVQKIHVYDHFHTLSKGMLTSNFWTECFDSVPKKSNPFFLNSPNHPKDIVNTLASYNKIYFWRQRYPKKKKLVYFDQFGILWQNYSEYQRLPKTHFSFKN